MPFAIIATKVQLPPPRPLTLARPTLVTRLQEGLSRKLTLICAPAGYGKSTVAREWAVCCGRSVSWFSVGEDERPIDRFLAYMIASLKPELTGLPDASMIPRHPRDSEVHAILTMIINAAARSRARILLVVDDLHLAASAQVYRALVYFIRHVPENLHPVLVTRVEPQLPVATYRLRQEVTEVGPPDLAFSQDEVLDLLRAEGVPPSTSAVEQLLPATDGWPAGIHASAIAMRRRGLRLRMTHGALDFLRQEVYKQQPHAIQRFLRRTSILDELCDPLCRSVLFPAATGALDDDAPSLDSLLRDGLFLIPLDHEGNWFRYHHLFREMLRAEAEREPVGELEVLHRRASNWFSEAHYPSSAARHAVASGDSRFASGMLERAWREMSESAQTDLWEQWAASIPEDVVCDYPLLSAQKAYVAMNQGHLDEAEERLTVAASDARSGRTLHAFVAIGRAFIAQARGDEQGTIHWAKNVLSDRTSEPSLQTSQAHALSGLAYWSRGDLDLAYKEYSHTLLELEEFGSSWEVLSMTFVLAEILIARGALSEAERSCQRARQLVESQNPESPGLEDIYRVLAEIEGERGNWEQALTYMTKARRLGMTSLAIGWNRRLLTSEAWMHACRQQFEESLRLLDEAERARAESPLPVLKPIPALRARVLRASGRSQAAAGALDRAEFSRASAVGAEYVELTRARLLIDDGQAGSVEQALGQLSRQRDRAIASGRRRACMEIDLLVAIAAHRADEVERARLALGRAVDAAVEESFFGLFLEEAHAVRQLIASVGGALDRIDLLETLRVRLSAGIPQPVQPAIGETLSERESQVLGLIAEGLSNAEICERLFLALDTVKGHNRRIFEKLNVNRRTQAVAKARQLGLV